MIDITIPIRVPTTNELLRMHFRARGRLLRQIAEEIWVALPKEARGRKNYMRRAEILIERRSSVEPDPDGLEGAKKLVLDVLQPASKRHPYGIGVIVNDDRGSVESKVRHVKCKPKERLTRIVIKEIDDVRQRETEFPQQASSVESAVEVPLQQARQAQEERQPARARRVRVSSVRSLAPDELA